MKEFRKASLIPQISPGTQQSGWLTGSRDPPSPPVPISTPYPEVKNGDYYAGFLQACEIQIQ